MYSSNKKIPIQQTQGGSCCGNSWSGSSGSGNSGSGSRDNNGNIVVAVAV